MTDYEILKQAYALIVTAITDEGMFDEGVGANYIVFDNAKRMVEEYTLACETGVINNEPIATVTETYIEMITNSFINEGKN